MSDELYAVIGRKQVALEQAYHERKIILNLFRQVVTGQLPKERVQVNDDGVTVLPE